VLLTEIALYKGIDKEEEEERKKRREYIYRFRTA